MLYYKTFQPACIKHKLNMKMPLDCNNAKFDSIKYF